MAFTICGIELFSNETNYIANESFLRPLDLDNFVSHEHKLVKCNLGILISFRCKRSFGLWFKVRDHLVGGSVSNKPVVHCYSGVGQKLMLLEP